MAMGLEAELYKKIEAKTAAYQMQPGDIGKIFTNRGAAGAVTLTLPDKDLIDAGWSVKVFTIADQDVTVNTLEGDNIVSFNEADADSVAFSTAGDKIGNGAEFVWDGTSWLCFLMIEGAVVTTLVD